MLFLGKVTLVVVLDMIGLDVIGGLVNTVVRQVKDLLLKEINLQNELEDMLIRSI
jgi:hypothetical protein